MRGILTIRRIEEGSDASNFEYRFLPRVRDVGMSDWIAALEKDIVDQIQSVQRLRIDQSAVIDVKFQLWAQKYWTYDGVEYDSGVYVCSTRTLRKSK